MRNLNSLFDCSGTTRRATVHCTVVESRYIDINTTNHKHTAQSAYTRKQSTTKSDHSQRSNHTVAKFSEQCCRSPAAAAATGPIAINSEHIDHKHHIKYKPTAAAFGHQSKRTDHKLAYFATVSTAAATATATTTATATIEHHQFAPHKFGYTHKSDFEYSIVFAVGQQSQPTATAVKRSPP